MDRKENISFNLRYTLIWVSSELIGTIHEGSRSITVNLTRNLHVLCGQTMPYRIMMHWDVMRRNENRRELNVELPFPEEQAVKMLVKPDVYWRWAEETITACPSILIYKVWDDLLPARGSPLSVHTLLIGNSLDFSPLQCTNCLSSGCCTMNRT